MKNNYSILVALFIVATTFAQAPEQMSYQAIVRDATGNLVTNQQVGMQISILQTTVSGTAVYVETQTPTTNANGLVTLEIGAGTTTDDFKSIVWSAASYFIKTETDPTGGSSYSITGTSQLLSVPYALYAKTATTAIKAENGIPEDGAEGQVLQFANDVPTWVDNTFSVFYKDIDGDGYGDINSIIVASGSAPNGYVANNTDCNDGDSEINPGQSEIYSDSIDNNCDGIINETYKIGDFTAGGVVFYIASTPTDLDGDGDLDNGLVAAIADQGAQNPWGNNGSLTGAYGLAIGTGASNTNAIIDVQGVPVKYTYAAVLARAYNGGGFNDWFLPSKDELNEMYINKEAINAKAVAHNGVPFDTVPVSFYWTSTQNQINNGYAWFQFLSLGQTYFSNVGLGANVRAVRAF
jgi:hypothetical protein